MELIAKFKTVFVKYINKSLASYGVFNISLNAVYVNDPFAVMLLDQMYRKFPYAFIVLCLDTGHVRDVDLE